MERPEMGQRENVLSDVKAVKKINECNIKIKIPGVFHCFVPLTLHRFSCFYKSFSGIKPNKMYRKISYE